MNQASTNLPILSVDQSIRHLSRIYCSVIQKGLSPKHLPSVMLWGPPGVGKSQAIRQIAKMLRQKTGKEVAITDVRLLLFNPIDLRGIPTANADKTLAVWLKPQIFQMSDREDLINILFLDEISAAPQSVQAAAYQITLDRVVGEHRLPDNCIIIAAGNRLIDKSVSFKMPKALANRLLHIEIEGSLDSWLQWAIKAGIHEKVIGYLLARGDQLFGFDARTEDLAFATPRSWEMVSNLLHHVCDDIEEIFPMIAGLIGNGAAISFSAWSKLYKDLPRTKDIFEGTVTTVPKDGDALYALTASMTCYAKDQLNNTQALANSLCYAKGMPADYQALLLYNYETLDPDISKRLINVPEYLNMIHQSGALRNGKV